MDSTIRKYIVKIPSNISVFYCTKNHILIFSTLSTCNVLKLKTKLVIDKSKKIIRVTKEIFTKSSNYEKKKLKSLQATQVALIKQMLLEISLFFCKKLNLVGVGFRVTKLDKGSYNLLHFKLGYSHPIYFKIPKNLKIFCLKVNKLFIIGNSYMFINQIAALIKSYKFPDPYKGKGILYTTEKITLKEGKKV